MVDINLFCTILSVVAVARAIIYTFISFIFIMLRSNFLFDLGSCVIYGKTTGKKIKLN